MKYKTLVVGLGKIGMMYNFSAVKKNYSNHCDVFRSEKIFELSGGVDIDKKKRKIFDKKFNIPSFESLTRANISLKPDIIVLSVPTFKFENIFKEIYSKRIKPLIFILEKPGGFNSQKLQFFLKYCKKNNINLIMNYTRNFSSRLNKISKFLSKKKLGKLKKIEIIYKKGVYNSCSHYLSFINNFFKLDKIRIIKKENFFKGNQDYFGNVSLKSTFDLNLLFTKHKHERINIIGSKGRLSYITEKNQVNYLISKKKTMIKCDFDKDQKNMINFVKKNIYARKKCYKIFEKNIFILQTLNKICKKI